MKNYRTILISLLALIVIWGLGCQPQAEVKTDQVPVIVEPAEKAPEAVTESTAEKTTAAEHKAATETVAEKPAEANAPKTIAPQIPAAEVNKPAAVQPPIETNDLAVTVNGVNILESQVAEQMKPVLKRISSQISPGMVEQYKKQLRQQILDKMIAEQLLDAEVKANNMAVTEEEVDAKITDIASRQEPPISLEDFKALVEAYGQSFDETKERIRKGISYQKLAESQQHSDVNVTEEDALAFYTENKAQFEVPERVEASHILIRPNTSDPNVDPNEAKVQAKAKAEELLAQLKAGADFATLAKEKSDCPSAAKGGDLGFFERGRMVPVFENAAFGLKSGQVSDIVETQFGYHIIKVTDHQDANVISFEQKKDELMYVLKLRRQQKLVEDCIESLKAKSNIVYPPGKEPDNTTRIETSPGRIPRIN